MYRIRHKLLLTMYTFSALKTNAPENLICRVVRIQNSCTVVDNGLAWGSSSIFSDKDVKITILNCIADCVRFEKVGSSSNILLALNFSTAGHVRLLYWRTKQHQKLQKSMPKIQRNVHKIWPGWWLKYSDFVVFIVLLFEALQNICTDVLVSYVFWGILVVFKLFKNK